MPGPFEATGAQKGPTRFGALAMGARQFTGNVTQRSPYRDGAVPYLVGKFYGGTRFDTIWDGVNREISQRLTDPRAAGSSVWNANDFPAANSLYPWKYIQNGVERVRVLYDGVDGTIYDATAGGKTALFAKTAGAGPARFLGVNTELFFTDGVENKKIVGTGKTWQANTKYYAGDLITDSNGNLQQAYAAPLALGILSVQQYSADTPGVGTRYWVQLALNGPMTFNTTGGSVNPWQVTLAGLTGATWLNGAALENVGPTGSLNSILLGNTTVAHAAYGPAADTGTATGITSQNNSITGYLGISGATQPAWNAAQQGLTDDGSGLIWMCFGNPAKAWGVSAPSAMPVVAPTYTTESYWQANANYSTYSTILDSNGSIQAAQAAFLSGFSQPNWSTALGGTTSEGTFTGNNVWLNCGQLGSWQPDTAILLSQCVLDSNGNIQVCIGAGTTGSAAPSPWGVNPGDSVTDGSVTWTNWGPGIVLRSASLQFSFSWHSIDGTVSTAAPLNLTVVNGVLGVAGGFALTLNGPNPTSDGGLTADEISQIDAVYLWATAQGGTTLIGLAQLPIPQGAGNWSYIYAQPDTQLNPFLPAPIDEQGDPPQVGMTAPVYYQQRVWAILENAVVYSEGPDAVTGNGNTQFPPLNEIPFPAQPIKLFPVLVQNGGLIVLTTGGIKMILGTGTSTNPYYVGDYLELVSILGYNAATMFYNQIFCMESNGKVSSIAIEYPFNPQSGYTEVGFPIGDQFLKTTQAGIDASIFNPATAYVSWNSFSSADTGMYVSSGTGVWYRMSLINPPESGILWSVPRIIQGGASAVQSVETAPGVHNVLIAPPAGTTGPILQRDTTGTVWTDWTGGAATPYPSWDAKGVTLLASTGQWASIRHISAKSVNTGGPRPTISVLFNEIYPSAERPYIALPPEGISNDPPRNPPSVSVYSDRYRVAQQGMEMTGDCILVKFDYGTLAYGDELLDWGIYGKVNEEAEEQAAKA
jgi:hypothetical protein